MLQPHDINLARSRYRIKHGGVDPGEFWDVSVPIA
jgi:hypothetical protein